jgi:hypothetical protein
MIKIDKDIPPPLVKVIGVTLAKMQVGESFLLGNPSLQEKQLLSRKVREMHDEGKVFTSMTEEDGIRTWRLE